MENKNKSSRVASLERVLIHKPQHLSPWFFALVITEVMCRYKHKKSKDLTQKSQYGSGCSKLTTLLFNETLKFQTLIYQICQYFLLKKCEKLLQCSAKASLIFWTKNFSVLNYKVVKHLMSWPLNGLVKLTMLRTTGPWCLLFIISTFLLQ